MALIVHSKLRSITPVQPKWIWYYKVFFNVNMDAWYYRISIACDIMEYRKRDVRAIWIRSPITYVSVIHSTWPSWTMWWTHARTFTKWQQKKKKKKKTLHMLTYGAMWRCGLTSLMVCIWWQILWYKGEKCDNKEWDLNYKHPFPRVLEY